MLVSCSSQLRSGFQTCVGLKRKKKKKDNVSMVWQSCSARCHRMSHGRKNHAALWLLIGAHPDITLKIRSI